MPWTPRDLNRAFENEALAQRQTNRLVKELNEAGHSWAELSKATGRTVSALRWRAGEMRGRKTATQKRASEGSPSAQLVAEQQDRPAIERWFDEWTPAKPHTKPRWMPNALQGDLRAVLPYWSAADVPEPWPDRVLVTIHATAADALLQHAQTGLDEASTRSTYVTWREALTKVVEGGQPRVGWLVAPRQPDERLLMD